MRAASARAKRRGAPASVSLSPRFFFLILNRTPSLNPRSLSSPQQSACAALVRRGPLTLRDLAREARLAPGDARRAVLALLQHSLATAHPLDGGLASTLAAAVAGGRVRPPPLPPSAGRAGPAASTSAPTPHLYAADEAGMLQVLRHPRGIDLAARLFAAAAPAVRGAGGGGGGRGKAAAPAEPSLPPHAHLMAVLATHGRLTLEGAVAAAAALVAEARGGGGGGGAKPTPADSASARSAFCDLLSARLIERAPPPCLPPVRPLAAAAAGADGSGADPAVDAAVAAYGRVRFCLPAGEAGAAAAAAAGPASPPSTGGRKRGRGGGDAPVPPPSDTTPLPLAPPPPHGDEADEALLLFSGGAPPLWRPARAQLNRRLRAEAMTGVVAARRGPSTAAVLGAALEAAMAAAGPAGPVAEGDAGGRARPGGPPPGPPYPPLARPVLEAALAAHRARLAAALAAGLLLPDAAEDLLPPADAEVDIDAELAALAEEGAVEAGAVAGGAAGAAAAAAAAVPPPSITLRPGTLLASSRASAVEAVVRTRFGPEGVRVVRLLHSARQLEQKAVGEGAMLPAKAARALLYRLLRGGAVSLQDIPRAADRAPSRSFYTWRVDERGGAARLAAESLAAAGNALARLVHEADAARVGEAAAALAAAPASGGGGRGGGGPAAAAAPPAGRRARPPPLSEERAAQLRAYSAHRRLLWARILALDGMVAGLMDG